MLLVKRCAVACYSPQLHWVLVPSRLPGPSWSPSVPRPRLWLQVAPAEPNLPRARSLLLSQLNPSSLPGPQPDFRISPSLSLSPPPSPSLTPSLPPWPCGANALATTSTRFPPIGHLLGSDRDTKTNLGTNPSISSKLVGAGIDTLNHLLTHTPARAAPSFSLCLASAHLVFPWHPPSLFPLDCNAGKIAQLSLTRTRPLLAAHVPVPS